MTDSPGGNENLRLEAQLVLRDLTEQVLRRFQARGEQASEAVAAAMLDIGRASAQSADRIDRTARRNAVALRRVDRVLGDTKDAVDRLTAAMDQNGRRAARAAQQTQGAFDLVQRGLNRIGIGTAALTAALSIAFAGGVRGARDYQIELARVGTLVEDARSQLPGLQTAVEDVASAQGQRVADTARGLYQTISAGAGQGADAVRVLNEAIELSRVAVSDQQTAVDAVTSVLNAYRLESEDVERVSSALFQTVQFGKTTLDEFGSSLGQILPTASNLGVPIEDVAAAIASITQSGASASEAVTQVRSVLVNLQRFLPRINRELARYGQQITTASIESQGFQQALELVALAGGDTAGIQELLGARVEALNAIINLTGDNADRFLEIRDKILTNVDAVDRVGDAFRENLGVRTQSALNELGNQFAGLGERLTQNIFDAFDEIEGSFSRLGFEENIEILLRGIGSTSREVGQEVAEAFDIDLDFARGSDVNTFADAFEALRRAASDATGAEISIQTLVQAFQELGGADILGTPVARLREFRRVFEEIQSDAPDFSDIGREARDSLERGLGSNTNGEVFFTLRLRDDAREELDAVLQGPALSDRALRIPVGFDADRFEQELERSINQAINNRETIDFQTGDFTTVDDIVNRAVQTFESELSSAAGGFGSAIADGLVEGVDGAVGPLEVRLLRTAESFQQQIEAALEIPQAEQGLALVIETDGAPGFERITELQRESVSLTDIQSNLFEDQNSEIATRLRLQAEELAAQAELATGQDRINLASQAQISLIEASIAQRAIAAGGDDEQIEALNRILDLRVRAVDAAREEALQAEQLANAFRFPDELGALPALPGILDSATRLAVQFAATVGQITNETAIEEPFRELERIQIRLGTSQDQQLARLNSQVDAAARIVANELERGNLSTEQLNNLQQEAEAIEASANARARQIEFEREIAPIVGARQSIEREGGQALLIATDELQSQITSLWQDGTASFDEFLSNTLLGIGEAITQALILQAILGGLGLETGSIGSLIFGGGGGSGGGGGIPQFAKGGTMKGKLEAIVPLDRGPTPMRSHATGGIASTPTLALFGEGQGEEAFVPLESGAIPVRIERSGGASAGGGMSIQVGGISLVVQSPDPAMSAEVLRAQLPEIESALADSLISGTRSGLRNSIRSVTRGGSF